MIAEARRLEMTDQVRCGARPDLFWADLALMGLLTLACLAMFFARLGSYGIIDPGDGYFAEAAREMVESGNYVTPHLNYQVYFSKPILIYWLIASAYHAFGISEFAARFWSAALSTCLVLATYWLGRTILNRKSGLLAGLILMTSPLVVTFARLSMVDSPLTCFVGLAVVALLMTTVAGSRRWWPVFYVSLALSVLIKGPVGVVLVAGAFVVFLIARRPSPDVLNQWLVRLHPWWGVLILLAIVLPWHLAVAQDTDWLFLKVFYLYENLDRFRGQLNHEHHEIWYYLPVLAYGFFPWVIFLPSAIANLLAVRRPDPHAASLNNARLGSDGLFFLACFAATVVVFFTLSATKLQTYVLPAFPALAVLVASVLDRWTGQPAKAPRWLKLALGALAVLAIGAALAVLVAAIFARGVPVWVKLIGSLTGFLLATGLVWVFLVFRRGRSAVPLYTLVAITVTGCALISQIAFEVGYRYRNAGLHQLIGPLIGRRAKVAFYQEFKPSMMFYLRRPVDTFFIADQLISESTTVPAQGSADASGGQLYVLSGKKGMQTLVSRHGDKLKLVDRKGPWCLLVAERLTLRKLPTLEESFRQEMKLDVGQHTWGTLPFAGGIQASPKGRG